MPTNDNLLANVRRWAHRQSENFTTDAFAHLLSHLTRHHPAEATSFLGWFADLPDPSELAGIVDCAVDTQVREGVHGIPDLQVATKTLKIVVEVKLDAGITVEQAASYRAYLQTVKQPIKRLVLLLGGRPSPEVAEIGIVRLWPEVAAKLIEIAPDDHVAKYLVEQFVGLLHEDGLAPPVRVRGGVGKALQDHAAWALSHPNAESGSLGTSRIRSLKTLELWPELAPLRELPHQMEGALARVVPARVRRLDSGLAGRNAWVGFGIDDMAYFFFLYTAKPEKLVLQRYRDGVDPKSFDGSFGEVTDHPYQGLHRWSASIDLVDERFFDADGSTQGNMLDAFLTRGFENGDRMAPSKPRPM